MEKESRCEVCGKVITENEKKAGANKYCSLCAIAFAEKDIAANYRKQLEEEAKRKKRFNWNIVFSIIQLLTITVAVFLVYDRYENVLTALQPAKPIRIGTYETDIKTDQCINNLWQISAEIQNGEIPANKYKCPSSRIMYDVFVSTPTDYVKVSCPLPEKHKLVSLSIRKDKPVPVAVSKE